MKKKIAPLLRVAFSLGLIALLYRKVDLHDLRDVFSHASLFWIACIFALQMANTGLNAFKWRQFLLADNIDIQWHSLFGKYLVAGFFSMFLPSNIGGDAYRVYAVAKKGSGAARSFASVLADRLTGFMAVVILGFVFCVIARKSLPNQLVLLIPGGAFVALGTAIAMLLEQSIARKMIDWPIFNRLPKLQKFGHDMLDSVLQYRRSPSLFFRALGISFVFQFNMIVCVFMLSRALHFAVPFHYFCMYVPVVTLFEALPISINGIGVRDALYVYFYGGAGLEKHEALSLAIAFVVTNFIYSLSGGLIFVFRHNRQREFQSLEKA